MSTEQLLEPRYKVIADYPQPPYSSDEENEHRFIEGDTLHYLRVNDAMTFRRVGRCGYMSVGVPCIPNPEKYPKIFKKLEWWQERKVEDMPEYVKFLAGDGEIFKVERYFHGRDGNMRIVMSDGKQYEVNENVMCFFDAATEQEYLTYQP